MTKFSTSFTPYNSLRPQSFVECIASELPLTFGNFGRQAIGGNDVIGDTLIEYNTEDGEKILYTAKDIDGRITEYELSQEKPNPHYWDYTISTVSTNQVSIQDRRRRVRIKTHIPEEAIYIISINHGIMETGKSAWIRQLQARILEHNVRYADHKIGFAVFDPSGFGDSGKVHVTGDRGLVDEYKMEEHFLATHFKKPVVDLTYSLSTAKSHAICEIEADITHQNRVHEECLVEEHPLYYLQDNIKGWIALTPYAGMEDLGQRTRSIFLMPQAWVGSNYSSSKLSPKQMMQGLPEHMPVMLLAGASYARMRVPIIPGIRVNAGFFVTDEKGDGVMPRCQAPEIMRHAREDNPVELIYAHGVNHMLTAGENMRQEVHGFEAKAPGMMDMTGDTHAFVGAVFDTVLARADAMIIHDKGRHTKPNHYQCIKENNTHGLPGKRVTVLGLDKVKEQSEKHRNLQEVGVVDRIYEERRLKTVVMAEETITFAVKYIKDKGKLAQNMQAHQEVGEWESLAIATGHFLMDISSNNGHSM